MRSVVYWRQLNNEATIMLLFHSQHERVLPFDGHPFNNLLLQISSAHLFLMLGLEQVTLLLRFHIALKDIFL